MASVGYIGLGIMGTAMAYNIKKSGTASQVTVWNRNQDKVQKLTQDGFAGAKTPQEVIEKSDITFACLSNPQAALEVVEQPSGVLAGIKSGKGYVDISTVDAKTSQKIESLVKGKGGSYVEAPVSGTKQPAIDGQLIFLAGGDKDLFDKAVPFFDIMGKKTMYLGEVGNGANMKLIVNTVMCIMNGSLAEGLKLAEKTGLKQEDLLDALGAGAMANGMFKVKGPLMMKREYPTSFPYKHAQKDVRLALEKAKEENTDLPIADATHKQFIKCQDKHADDDFAAIYEALNF